MSEYAAIPMEAEISDAPKSNMNIAEMETPRVLFFAMDTITDQEKRELPFKQFGGIFLPQVKLLGNKGMLYRCQLTRLPKSKMIPEWKNMLGNGGSNASIPTEDAFVQTVVTANGIKETQISGFMMSDTSAELKENGEFKQKRSNHVTYRKRYAAQDAAMALRRAQMGHAPGGVVEITALKGATPAAVREAQYYFFPKWDDIRQGAETLPETIDGVEAHLKARIADIKNQLWGDERKKQYHEIGKDMLMSCSEYRRRAVEAVRADERIVKDADAKGAGSVINHSVISERYKAQTGIKSKDDLLTGEASNVATLTQVMLQEREEKKAHDAKMLLLEERKQYTAEIQAGLRERDEEEEIRLGIKKAVPAAAATIEEAISTAPSQVEIEEFAEDLMPDAVTVEEVEQVDPIITEPASDTETRVCAAENCSRVPKEGEFCWQHGK